MMNDINDALEIDGPDDADALSISALMDGALTGPDADAALTAAAQPDGQTRWQLYHLIGDTLRAPDLAAHHHATLLTGVRAAMGQPMQTEPALPLVVPRRKAANDGAFRWKLASGFAAVVAVAAIGWNVWGVAGAPRQQQLAQAQAQPVQSQTVEQAAPEPDAVVINVAMPDAQHLASSSDSGQPQMLRDPQLDRLLAAHRRMAAFGGRPSAFLRNATFEEPER
jgi:sigma-E factor negative regulatory protein RseA